MAATERNLRRRRDRSHGPGQPVPASGRAAAVPSAAPGAIVEFHLDGPATEWSTAVALPGIIDGLRSQGYDLVTVADLAKPCPA